MSETGSRLSGLVCGECGAETGAERPVGVCAACGHTLFARYDLDALDGRTWMASLRERPATLWRYRELLPVRRSDAVVTLGEGYSPIVELSEVPEAPGVGVWAKDDGGLPTGSFKARGMALAVSRA